MIPKIKILTLSPGEMLDNIKISITKNGDVIVYPRVRHSFKKGDIVHFSDNTYGIIASCTDFMYNLSYRIDSNGNKIKNCTDLGMYAHTCTNEEKDFVLDMLYQDGLYLSEDGGVKKATCVMHKGQIYYTVCVENEQIIPCECTWENDEYDKELKKKNLVFKSLEACEFFIKSLGK